MPPYFNVSLTLTFHLAEPKHVVQEAELSQRDRAMLRVIEYFAESKTTPLSRVRVSPY